MTDSGTEITRSPEKAGISNLIEILAAVRGITPEQVEQEFERLGLRRLQGGRGRRGGRVTWPRSGSATASCATTRMGSTRSSTPAPRRPARSPPTRSPTCARRWASGRSGSACNVCTVRLIDLELDLDVFAGPFDLLLTLILREEVDLLEVDLAEIVIAYIDHLERRGELDLEAATEFLVLIAALLELKSRLMLPGEEEEEIDLDPGEAAEELLARLLDAHRYRAVAEHLAHRLGDESGVPVPLGAAAAVAAAGLPGRRVRGLRPQHAGGRARRPARAAQAGRRAAHDGGQGERSPSASRTCGRCCVGVASLRRRRGAGGSRDGRGDPVRAARAVQAGRADLDPGRAVRRDHDRRPGRGARSGQRHERRARAHARGAAVPERRPGRRGRAGRRDRGRIARGR